MIAKSLAEAQDGLAEIVRGVERDHNPVVLTEDGRPVAAVVSMADYLWMEEAEDRWLSKLVADVEADPDHDPRDTIPAEEAFRQLRERDKAKPADAAE